MSKRKVSIVFEETGEQNGSGFNVYLEGLDRDIRLVASDKLSPAEFWASKGFSILIGVLRQAGVVQTERPNPKSPGQSH